MSKEFEVARLLIIQAAHDGRVDEARAFGWAHRIMPLSTEPLEVSFEDDFEVKASEVDAVVEELVEMQESDKPASFYQLEGDFGENRSGLSRANLIYVLRMIFLNDRFNEKLWNDITTNAPAECKWLAKPFAASEDLHI